MKKVYKHNGNIKLYFNAHNYAYDKPYKESYHRYQVYKLFDTINNYGNLDISEFINKLYGIEVSIKYLINKCAKTEHDYRSGENTYGYSSVESIRNNLRYISDRWYSQFRLQWLWDIRNANIY